MEIKERRRVGIYTCWHCHRDFPLYEGQKRKYCDDCLPMVARQFGKQGGRGNKKENDIEA